MSSYRARIEFVLDENQLDDSGYFIPGREGFESHASRNDLEELDPPFENYTVEYTKDPEGEWIVDALSHGQVSIRRTAELHRTAPVCWLPKSWHNCTVTRRILERG